MAVQLDREEFLVRLISLYSLLHQLDDDSRSGAYIRQVGLRIAQWIDDEYKRELGVTRLTPQQYAEVIVDLKRRIEGDFFPISVTDSQVVVGSRSCPFGQRVQGAPNLCNMTSSVFGGIAARNFGYGKVILHKRIAVGHEGCHVAVYLKPGPEAEAEAGIVYREGDLPRDYTYGAFGLRWDAHRIEGQSVAAPHSLLFNLPQLRDQMLNETGVGLIVLDAGGNPIMLNPLADLWCGQERGDAILERAVSLAHVARQGEPATAEVEVCSDQRTLYYHLRAARLNSDAGFDGVFIVIRDVTEHTLLTRRLIDSERLHVMGELAASAAHDLRNPLATVRSLLQLAIRKGGTLTEEFAQTMLAEIDRAAKVIQDYLMVAKVPTPSTEPVHLPALLVQVQQLVGTLCAASGVALRVYATDLAVLADRSQLLQVLLNLTSNAIDAMPDGGTLTLRAEAAGAYGRIAVEDTGQGIAPKHLDAIYNPFFTTKAKGTGLGLYISRYLVEQMGGRIECRSQVDTGTTFGILLPHGR